MAKILLVEDNFMMSECYQRWLNHAGHKVIIAQNAQSAFDVLDEAALDLIVLDLLLPGVNGLQLLQLLPSHPDWVKIPVILCSSAPPDAPQIEAYGVRAILDKALLTREALCDCVAEALHEDV